MVWTAETSAGNEVRKVRDRIAGYLHGKILDIGCGAEKVCSEAVGIDLHSSVANIMMDVSDPDALKIFSDGAFDVVFSSHFLEDIHDYKGMIKEMWRLVAVDGVLVLYLPHKDLYPNVGEYGANINHKHDFLPDDIIACVPGFVERNEVRSEDNEYSFELIFSKTHGVIEKKQYDKSKTVVVVRYGGFGDMAITAPIYRLYKELGYYVIANCSKESSFVLDGNPYVDEIIVQSRYAIPSSQLGEYFAEMEKEYGKVVNLCETMERALLVEKEDEYVWNLPHEERHKLLDKNYSDFAVARAGLDSKGNRPELYLTDTEKVLLGVFSKKHAGYFKIMWQLSGSSWHKIYPFASDAIEELIEEIPEAKFFLTGGDNISLLGLDHERIENRISVWGPRQAMVATSVMDCVVSPETGVLNASGAFDVPKIGLLTHSSKENLTKYFANDFSIQSKAKCSPCHKMIHDLADCPLDKEFGLPVCMSVYMDKEEIKKNVHSIYSSWSKRNEI